MVPVRRYAREDAIHVGVLIADTFGEFNLGAHTADQSAALLGPFVHARSSRLHHREAIASAIEAPSVWVAERDGIVIGVLRGGRSDRRGRTVLSSLFVDRLHHRQGVGTSLVDRFEHEYQAQGVSVFSVAATEQAIPFYLSIG